MFTILLFIKKLPELFQFQSDQPLQVVGIAYKIFVCVTGFGAFTTKILATRSVLL